MAADADEPPQRAAALLQEVEVLVDRLPATRALHCSPGRPARLEHDGGHVALGVAHDLDVDHAHGGQQCRVQRESLADGGGDLRAGTTSR